MTIQLRQICLVAHNLDSSVKNLTDILGINSCYVDPEVEMFGLENNLMSIGRNFLEVVSPIKENTAGGRYLERRSGDGGYMVITQADTFENQRAIRQKAVDLGIRIAHESEQDGWNICQLHPADLKAAFLEIEYDKFEDFQGNWMPANGLGWKDKIKQDVTVDYLGVELQSYDPLGLAKLWGSITDLDVVETTNEIYIELNNVKIRFVEVNDGRGPGLGGLDILVADRDYILEKARERNCDFSEDRVDICGTRFYLHDK